MSGTFGKRSEGAAARAAPKAVAASASEKRWAGVLLRSTDGGATWTTLSEPRRWGLIHAIWGNGRGEVWAAGGIPTSQEGVSGEYGFVMRWDGKAWAPLSDVGFDAVEIAGGVAWFSGDAGRIGRLRLAE